MRLTSIKLAGFKSFVDPIHIPIPGQLVGIVGPNGSGKSNIVDAVRWVLGESKAAVLRGETMQDVIFNGSTARKPVGRASVELIFDNSLGKAAGQWSQYAEISVKRVLERNGESSYFVNNLHVRRRDVADIFLGTGLGARAYAIIEQGMISRIVEAKPEELRVFLEEAAGVSKYRERRRETELRLKDARENLARVNDIRQELAQQLIRLEEQARVATRYRELQGEVRTAQCLLWLTRKQEAAASRSRLEKEIQRLETELEAETARLRDAEKHLESARDDHYARGDALHQAQGELYGANAEVARLEQQLAHLKDSRSRLSQQIAAASSQIEHHRRQLESTQTALDHWRKEHALACEGHEAKRLRAENEAKALPLLEEAYRNAQEALGETQRELLLAEQGRQVEETHRGHAARALAQLEARKARLEEERAALPQIDPEALARWEQVAWDAEAALREKQEALVRLGETIPEVQRELRVATEALQVKEQRLTETEARRQALAQLQERIGSDEKLAVWLARHGLDRGRRLWQGIRIEAGFEDALEAVLRERLNALVQGSALASSDWADDAPPGRLTLVAPPPPSPLPTTPEELTPLARYVSVADTALAPVLEDWLAGVFVAPSFAQGLSERMALAPGHRLVTREGHIFTRSGVTYYAPDSEIHGLLARQREIESLMREAEALRSEVEQQRTRVREAEERLREQEAARARLGEEVAWLQQKRHEAQMEALKLGEVVERSAQRAERIGAELEEIEQHMAAEITRQREAELKLAQWVERIAELAEQLEAAKGGSAAAAQRLSRQREAAQQAAREAQDAAYYEKTCLSKINELDELIKVISENIRQAETQVEALQGEWATLDSSSVEEALQRALELQREKEKGLVEARNALEEVASRLKAVEEERLAAEHRIEPLRAKLEDTRLKEQEARIVEEQFAEQLQEAGADEEALVGRLAKGAKASALQGEIARLNEEIAALGAINLAALEELTSAQERKAFLDAQFQDLTEAVETLENAIRRIDRETRERLLDTYEEVNRHLGEIFPALFGGGQAKLLLTGEEILDAGLQLIAQPPGKKNAAIHLLSGGEKALVALALVFSLFRLNPAPFCLLDEVDAPLDDTNTERFCELVKRFSQDTQFVFISHNKITMEMAQQLIGVTMQEQGVSRIVAVDIEEAIRMRDGVPA